MEIKAIQQIKQRYKIIGNSEELNRAINVAIQIAPTNLSVLIVGESGVGKEIIPRIIHDNSKRKHNKYIAINCGSIPEGTIDSELFGHAKGAFTGAIGEREGYFATANNGTLFLDEVGELPLATQARLLRVLETGEYIRVGESEVRKTNVRIVAATNIKMQKAISEGKFREDLYYRLNTIPISLPPLRERGKDIELLFKKFALDFSEEYHIDPIFITNDARNLLLNYKWPGNIRQLKNIVEQISIINKEREITSTILEQYGVTDDRTAQQGLVVIGRDGSYSSNHSHHSYESERDMLFQLLSSIGKEVKDLKEMVLSNVSHMNMPHSPIQAGNINGINNFTPSSKDYQNKASIYDEEKLTDLRHFTERSENLHHQGTYISNSQGLNIGSHSNSLTDYAEAEQVIEEAPKSMKELEKISIKQALDRNRGKRKRAASELGISERTLYRKIKEYDLD